MPWGSERATAADFARELAAYRAEHGTPTIEAISTAAERLSRPRPRLRTNTNTNTDPDTDAATPADHLGETLSTGRISGAMAGTNASPPTAAMVFSFVRAILHLENPDAAPITPDHPDVLELEALRTKAFARKELATFRERHLRAALQSPEATARHGCFALHALDGTTLHIGSTTSESLADRVSTVLSPERPLVNREHVAELELWPMSAPTPDANSDLSLDSDPHSDPDPDPTLATTVTRVEEALILRALYASAPATLRLPTRNPVDEPTIPPSRIFPLVDAGTLLAVREALHEQASDLASRAKDAYDRTTSTFQRKPREEA
ncbi:MAG: hypothetical protein HOW97_37440 [Catenulispora sp.]|nr:hypothetical protein [Catenulispora sp.]